MLLDDRYLVPHVAPARDGVAWLRANVVRFSEGTEHGRRRRIVEALLGDVDQRDLRRPGDHVATLASALGVPRSVTADVRTVAACYQPHTEITPAADAAVSRLVKACGGRWDEETANRIALLVQACDATAGLIAGRDTPVASTRRLAPDGREVVVDLSGVPFGAGRHECPGRSHAVALADGARRFHRLHEGPEPLVLPNAWDAASAAAFVGAGFDAVGTTSLGVAAATGVPDAAGLTHEATMTLARVLVRLPVPVTLDIESGWGEDLAVLAAELAESGVAGVNIEDGRGRGLADPRGHAALIQRLRSGAPNLFVNARVDTHWLGVETETTLDRARRYVDAGADGVFVPGLTDDGEIARLTAGIDAPLNLLAGSDPRRLAELGVRRISTGSLPYRAALAAALETVRSVRDGGPFPDALPYREVDALASRRPGPS